MTDISKVLAICLAYIDKEIAKIHPTVITEIHRDNRVDELVSMVERMSDEIIKELPDELIYESHLVDSIRCVKEELQKLFDDRLGEVHDSIINRSSILQEQYDALQDSLNVVRNEVISRLTESLDSLSRATKGSIDDLTQSRELHESHLKSELHDLSEEFSDKYMLLKQSIDSFQKNLETRISGIEISNSHNNEESRKYIDATIDHLSSSIMVLIELSKKETLDKVGSQIIDIKDIIHEMNQRKSDIDHVHNYADELHTHEDMASKRILDKTINELSLLIDRYNHIERDMASLGRSIASKPNSNDILKLSDLQNIKDQIIGDMERRIRIPKDGKDGKDGHEWEFKWHPNVKGRLMFRRSDQTEWQWEDLLVKVSQMPVSYGAMGMGGGGSSSSGQVIAEAPYVQNLTGLSMTIPNSVHGKRQYAIVRVYDETRREALLDVYQDESGNVHVSSLIDLQGYYIVISNP